MITATQRHDKQLKEATKEHNLVEITATEQQQKMQPKSAMTLDHAEPAPAKEAATERRQVMVCYDVASAAPASVFGKDVDWLMCGEQGRTWRTCTSVW